MTRARPVRALLLPLLLLAAAGARADSSAPFLWQIKGAQTMHYLLGSVHLLPASAETLPDGIADAYDAVDGLVFESDIGALSSPNSGLALISAAKDPRGLKAGIDPATYARLKARMAALGMPAALCEQYKAWFCALSLEVFTYQKAGFSGEYGLDQQLYALAKADEKHLAWFESPAAHLGLFTTMDAALGRQMLAATLADPGSASDDPAQLFQAWRNNDTGTLERLVADMKMRYPKIYARLLAQRNRAWAARLRRLLDAAEPQLIVVGAAHLVGPDGLLAQLKAEGYSARPYVVANPDLITATPGGPALVTAAAVTLGPESSR